MYKRPIARVVTFEDVKVRDENTGDDEVVFDTLEEAQEELRKRGKALFEVDQVDLIKGYYTINHIDLRTTEEYKNYSATEMTCIGDDVEVEEDNLEISITTRVVKRKYNVLTKERVETELSNVGLKRVITLPELEKEVEKIPSMDNFLDAAKDLATDLINAGIKNSHVVVRKNEILIMDTDDINTAQKVWRFNVNGLGYSSTGYYGQFGLAMTMDGSIVADFINTGILKANLIKSGILASHNGITQINMENGAFSFANKIRFDGTNFDIDLSGKDLATNSSVDTKIEVNNKGINETITDVQKGLQTQITKNADGIKEKVSSGDFNTYKEQTAMQISNKVSSGDVSSIIQQDYNSVKIGFNGISNRFGIDDYGFYLANNGGTKVLNADTSGNLNMNIWGGRLKMSATGTRKAEMWCDVYDRFIMNIPYTQEGSGIWIKRDTGATILVDTARADNPYYKVWIAEMTSPAIKTNYLNVTGGLDVAGAKNCLVNTENYGQRRISAYETAEYYFGDLGFGFIENGECIVTIDDVFQDCVNTNIEYHVFTQVYNGKIESIERHSTYFIVKGEEGTEFSWEIKAKRKGYENNRLDTVELIQIEEIENYHFLLDESKQDDLLEIENLLFEDISLEDKLLRGNI